MGQERERHAEDIDVLGLEQAGVFIDLVARAPQAAPDHLLTQKLAGEGTQPHDVGDRLGIPPLAQHADGDDLLDLFAGLAPPPHRVHRHPQLLGLLRPGQLVGWSGFFLRIGFYLLLLFTDRLFLRLGGGQHLRVDVQDALRVAQLVDVNLVVVEGELDPRLRSRCGCRP